MKAMTLKQPLNTLKVWKDNKTMKKVETKIEYNDAADEFTVSLWVDHERVINADYFTDDHTDAKLTAAAMIKDYAAKHPEKPAEITLTREQVEIEIIVEPETTPIKGNALASGNDETDRAYEDSLQALLAGGDIWAWCQVEVAVTYRGFHASDYLGCCSYVDQDDFKRSGYYEDMVQAALDTLNDDLNDMRHELNRLAV